MRRYKTSAIMRAIVADASRPGEQRDAASRVLTVGGKWRTWRMLYDSAPYSMTRASGVSLDGKWWGHPARAQAVHDALVALAKHYGIQPTEDA